MIIVTSTLDHVKELSDTMREADKNELSKLGMQPHKALFYSFKFSLLRKTALIDDKVAAMWGVYGVPTGMTGQPYLLTSPLAESVSPLKFAKIYINEVNQMKKLFPVLQNYVDASYTGAIRMLRIAGFDLEPVTLNNHEFYKFSLSEVA
jgi:hypothetical protein